jgi:hypothetical protein
MAAQRHVARLGAGNPARRAAVKRSKPAKKAKRGRP